MPQYVVREVECKSVINRVRGMDFEWSINPYRGCRHACVYCYARPTHAYLGMNGAEQFQEVIFAKVNAPTIVRRELARRSWGRGTVVMGTATDPYQQAESRYQITRGILQVFRDFGNPVSITTKSPMILRDLDLLTALSRKAQVAVSFTVTTLDEVLWRKLEPTTSKPLKRLQAVKALRNAGIRAGIFLSPILPGLTDDDHHLEEVVAAAAEYGADFLYGDVLRLGPGITEYYRPFIQKDFPDLSAIYERLYSGKYARGEYRNQVKVRLSALKQRYGFDDPIELAAKSVPVGPSPVQLSLLNPMFPLTPTDQCAMPDQERFSGAPVRWAIPAP